MTKKHVWTCSPDTSIDDGTAPATFIYALSAQQSEVCAALSQLVTSLVRLASTYTVSVQTAVQVTRFSADATVTLRADNVILWMLLASAFACLAALESLVEHRITGLPVVDEDGKVVGVVSDYDMLTLDNVSGRMESTGIFPTASMDWEAFHEVQRLILKNTGKL